MMVVVDQASTHSHSASPNSTYMQETHHFDHPHTVREMQEEKKFILIVWTDNLFICKHFAAPRYFFLSLY